jgi:hypothetical protein
VLELPLDFRVELEAVLEVVSFVFVRRVRLRSWYGIAVSVEFNLEDVGAGSE